MRKRAMVKPLTKVKMQPVLVSVQFSLVPCGRRENVERFHLNKISGQIFQPVENSSRILVNVRIIKTCILLSYICALLSAINVPSINSSMNGCRTGAPTDNVFISCL